VLRVGGTAAPPSAILPHRQRAPPAVAAWLVLALAGPAGAEVDAALLARHDGERVAEVLVDGARVTRDYVIRREIRTRVGEPLDPDVVRQDVVRLANLGIFASVTPIPEDSGPGEVRLRYVVREIPSWLPTVAMTYTEQNGFSVGPGLVAPNLTGRDLNVSAKAFFGGTRQYIAKVQWPWISGENHLSLDFEAARRERYDTLNEFQEASDELLPWVGRYLGEHGRVGASLGYLDTKSDVYGKTLSPDNKDRLHRFGARLGWDTRDSWIDTRHGWQSEIELLKTGGVLGGDGDFVTLDLDLRRWQPIGTRQKVMITGLLTLQSGVVGRDLPVYLQYHLGGANTIRGYDVDVLGKTLYGRDQLIGTVEYSYTVVPMRHFKLWKFTVPLGLQVCTFLDAGIAWTEPGDFALRRARAGGGVGLRLLNPFTDIVRLDVGWSPEGGLNFHFASGLKPVRQRDRLR